MVGVGKRQTLMFSATFPEEVQLMAARFMMDYIFITVGILGGACNDVKQHICEVPKKQKKDQLLALLDREVTSRGKHKIIIFVAKKKDADFLATWLSEIEQTATDKKKYLATSIHGDRFQSQREMALRDFSVDRKSILVATDVAARGLDIPNIDHVINYDMPKEIDIYVHRIGRTGRVGNIGKATSFFDPRYDSHLKSDLVKILTQANQEIPGFLGDSRFASRIPAQSSYGGQDIREVQPNV